MTAPDLHFWRDPEPSTSLIKFEERVPDLFMPLEQALRMQEPLDCQMCELGWPLSKDVHIGVHRIVNGVREEQLTTLVIRRTTYNKILAIAAASKSDPVDIFVQKGDNGITVMEKG